MLQLILVKFNIQGPWAMYYVCVHFQENHHYWRGVTASLLNQISTRYLKLFMNYSGLKITKFKGGVRVCNFEKIDFFVLSYS